MKANHLKALDIETDVSELLLAQQEIAADAQKDAEGYVKSAKVDLGGE